MLIPSKANYQRYLEQCEMIQKNYNIDIDIKSQDDDYIDHLYKLVSEYGNLC